MPPEKRRVGRREEEGDKGWGGGEWGHFYRELYIHHWVSLGGMPIPRALKGSIIEYSVLTFGLYTGRLPGY